MRGRYTAAIWLFAVLLLGLLAVGASAPRPRESARLRIARVELARRSAQARHLVEDSSICPESGCLRDCSTEVRKNESADAPTAIVTSSAEASDPSARDFAYQQLVDELQRKWAQQPSKLEPTVIVYVSAEASPASYCTRWQTLLIPDLSVAVDRLSRTATDIFAAAYEHWESWMRITRHAECPEITPLSVEDQALESDAFDGKTDDRFERSILVRVNSNRFNETIELAERDKQSVLIR